MSHVDLTPTLLEMAGLEAPEGLSGSSVAPALRGASEVGSRVLFSMRQWNGVKTTAVRRKNWKLIHQAGEYILFDLDEDPDEQRGVGTDKKHIADFLLEEIDSRRNRLLDRPDVDDGWRDERLRQLRGLGYI